MQKKLNEHHVPCPSGCALCTEAEESVWHLLLPCDLSIRRWQEAGLCHAVQGRMQRYFNIAGAILDICSREVVDVVARLMMLLWGIWHNRNDQVWNHHHRCTADLHRCLCVLDGVDSCTRRAS